MASFNIFNIGKLYFPLLTYLLFNTLVIRNLYVPMPCKCHPNLPMALIFANGFNIYQCQVNVINIYQCQVNVKSIYQWLSVISSGIAFGIGHLCRHQGRVGQVKLCECECALLGRQVEAESDDAQWVGEDEQEILTSMWHCKFIHLTDLKTLIDIRRKNIFLKNWDSSLKSMSYLNKL